MITWKPLHAEKSLAPDFLSLSYFWVWTIWIAKVEHVSDKQKVWLVLHLLGVAAFWLSQTYWTFFVSLFVWK